MRKLTVLLSLFATLSFGEILKFQGTSSPAIREGKEVSANDKVIPVFPEASIAVPELKELSNLTLKETGGGVRVKKILFNFDAYWMTSYVLKPEEMKGAPLEAIPNRPIKALKLTFLRDLDAAKLKDAFESALIANGLKKPFSDSLQDTFKKMTFDVKEGESLTMLSVERNGEDHIYFEVPGKASFATHGKDLGKTFWLMWFGAGDGKLKELQPLLVNKLNQTPRKSEPTGRIHKTKEASVQESGGKSH